MGWIVVLVVVSVLISSLKKKLSAAAAQNQGQNQPPNRSAGGQQPSPQTMPMSKEEQVRRVREEIQRKILERRDRDRQAVSRSESARVPPVLVGGEESQRREARSLPTPPAMPPPLPMAVDETMERQRALAERIRELEARHARSQENAVTAESLSWNAAPATAESLSWNAAPAAAQLGPRAIRADLRDVHGVRRAMLLREVLGTPIGLR